MVIEHETAQPVVNAHTERAPWGILALLQFLSFTVIAVLVWDAFGEIHAGQAQATGTVPGSFLLDTGRYIEASLIPRLDRAFAPDLSFVALQLGDGVSIWALVSILGNFVSAIILFYIAATFKEHRWLAASVIAFTVVALLLSAMATPLLFSVLRSQRGEELLLDVSVVSFLIFIVYLFVDIVSAYGTAITNRQPFITLILGMDLPCILTTLIFITCNHYGTLTPSFTVGVSAGLLTLYSLGFFFLCAGFWVNTKRGSMVMSTIRGPIAAGIAVGAALNAAVGFFVQLIKLPIYLDLVGSILVALLFGPVAGILSAILGSIISGLVTTPITIAYVGTAVGVTAAAWYLKRYGFGKRGWLTVVMGTLVLGPLSSILSIPITTYLFSGVTFTGSDAVTAFFRTLGFQLLTSVATGAFFFDAIDKGFTSLLAYLIYQRAPRWLTRT